MDRRLQIIVAAVVLAAFVYVFHIPLPRKIAGAHDHHKVQIAEFVLRMTYFYPVKLLRFLGVNWQIFWTRLTLHNLSHITNPWTSSEPDLKITESTFDGVKVRVYEPKTRYSDGAMIFIHGGGFVLFNVESFEGPIREIVRQSRILTISIEYRLAPEHTFPGGLDDCMKAVTHFLRRGFADYKVNPAKVALLGDSAGGNLVAVVAQKLRLHPEPALPKLKAQLLVYPLLQFVDFQTPSYQMYKKYYDGSALLDPGSIARYMLVYANIDPSLEFHVTSNVHASPEILNVARSKLLHRNLPDEFFHPRYELAFPTTRNLSTEVMAHEHFDHLQASLLNPDLSPLMHPDLSGLPDTLLITGEYDILRDEGYLYARRLQEAGVRTTYLHYDEGFHGMMNFHSDIGVGHKLLCDIASYLRRTLY